MNDQAERRIVMQYGFTTDMQKVLVSFSEPVGNMTYTPKEAAQVAQRLLGIAGLLDPESVRGFTYPENEGLPKSREEAEKLVRPGSLAPAAPGNSQEQPS